HCCLYSLYKKDYFFLTKEATAGRVPFAIRCLRESYIADHPVATTGNLWPRRDLLRCKGSLAEYLFQGTIRQFYQQILFQPYQRQGSLHEWGSWFLIYFLRSLNFPCALLPVQDYNYVLPKLR